MQPRRVDWLIGVLLCISACEGEILPGNSGNPGGSGSPSGPGGSGGPSGPVGGGGSSGDTGLGGNPGGTGTGGWLGNPGIPATVRPLLVLTPAALDGLRTKAMHVNAAWTKLQSKCNNYLTGVVDWPDENAYPDGGSIGEGYQGSGYFDNLLNVGLCYQIARAVDPAHATQYGAKGVDILIKMSEPSGAHAINPLRDDGYGIRFYGVGMAIGYDWLYQAMQPADRQRVYTALNTWISTFDSGGFARNHPQGNYFAGYYAAKGLSGLSTDGDNPMAAAQWNDWLTRLHGQMVQPYYAANLTGGGWPEGWNYGPTATLNMWWPILGARTARGLDLINKAEAPFLFPVNQGLNLIHFAWPNRLTLDDREIQYNGDNPAATPSFLYTYISGMLNQWQTPAAPYFHSFARAIRAAQPNDAPAWQELLFWDDSAAESSFTTLPLSYVSHGMEEVAMRSSWDTSAVWASFASGPYTNNPDSGEQYFDQGSLAIVRGGQQLLVNTVSAIQRNTPGTNDGGGLFDTIYSDMYGGNRDLFNIFYVADPTPYGQDTAGPGQAKTHLARYEDGGSYVAIRGANLSDMCRGNGVVRAWTRDIVYLRPRLFIVYDRTTIGNGADDQWQAFHLAAQPVPAASPSAGANRFDVTQGSTFAGSVTTLLPAGHRTQAVNVFGHNKVYRLEVRPGAAGTEQRWLAVFDAAGAPSEVAAATRLSAADGNVLAGNALGVSLQAAGGNFVVLAGAGEATEILTGEVRYVVPASLATHVVTDVTPNTDYAVTVDAGATHTVHVLPGTGLRSSAGGVLTFQVAANGVVGP